MPVQVPLSAVSVWPSWAVPEIVGGDVLAGLAVVAAAVATAVAAEVAVTVPSAFLAVTTKRSVLPTSDFVTV